MALPTISASDFIGAIKLSQNSFRTTQLTDYITVYYPEIIGYLIGEAALQEIQDTAPLPQKYIDLLEGTGVYYLEACDANAKKPRLVDVVRYIIYFQWVRDYSINTTAGDVSNQSENAVKLNRHELASNARQRYNWAIRMFNNQVVPFLDNYKDYKSAIDGINDLGGGILEILTSDTIYLQDGDTVTIGGTDYVISNLVADTSFEINATFTSAESFTYNPFAVVVFEKQDPVLF